MIRRNCRPDPRRIKANRCYTIQEAADLLKIHFNTINLWMKKGLQPIDSGRPILIFGARLISYIEDRRRESRQPLSPGQCYCMTCRAPKTPRNRFANLRQFSANGAILEGICPDCGRPIFRRIGLDKLESVKGDLEITSDQRD